MNQTQYAQLRDTLEEKNIFGQFVSIIVKSDNGFNAAAKRAGWTKVTTYKSLHVPKKGYIETLNTSTGAIEAGVEFSALRESYYNSEAANGFCSHLKSNPDEKYIRILYDRDKSDPARTVYVSPEGNIISDVKQVEHLFTDSYRKKRAGEPSNTPRGQVIAGAEIDVRFLPVKIANVVRLKVSGMDFQDYNNIPNSVGLLLDPEAFIGNVL